MAGMFEDQYIFLSLSLFISMCTIERNSLNILERLDDIVVV